MKEIFYGAFLKVSVKFDLGRWFYFVLKFLLFEVRNFCKVRFGNISKMYFFLRFMFVTLKRILKIFKVKVINENQ